MAGGEPEGRGVDVALLDGTFYDPSELPGRNLSKIGHPFITSSVERLKSLNEEVSKEIYFIHINHTNPVLDEESEASIQVKKRGFHIAREGDLFAI